MAVLPHGHRLNRAPRHRLVSSVACNRPQVIHADRGTGEESLEIPGKGEQLLPGVVWGAYDVLFTPAFWKSQAWLRDRSRVAQSYRMGATLREEVAACILGGHGTPAEVGIAAFVELRDRGLLDGSIPAREALKRVLDEPLAVSGRRIRYRFAGRRSQYLHEALHTLSSEAPPTDSHQAFRAWLLRLCGVGLKTASWITRNWLGSNEVAIIDIHIFRAGRIAGVFERVQSLTSSYFDLEQRFLSFARSIDVAPADLDALIWCQMRIAGKLAIKQFDTLH
jgi:N-glycosylase/DNA lyase